jgi:hypothetical protein
MSFDPEERAVLGGLADVLIPMGDSFPSATQAGVATTGLDEVLTYRPDLTDPLKQIVTFAAAMAPAKALAQLQAKHPDLFGALTDFVPGAYFLNADVRTKLGYRGQVPHPISSFGSNSDLELLQSVIDRGPIYRPTPDRANSSH